MTTAELVTDFHRQLVNVSNNYKGDHDFQVIFGTVGLMDYLAARNQKGSLFAVAGSLAEFLQDVSKDREDDRAMFWEFLNKVAGILDSLLIPS